MLEYSCSFLRTSKQEDIICTKKIFIYNFKWGAWL